MTVVSHAYGQTCYQLVTNFSLAMDKIVTTAGKAQNFYQLVTKIVHRHEVCRAAAA